MDVRGLKIGSRKFLVPPPLLPGVGEEFKFPSYDPIDIVLVLLGLGCYKMTVLLIKLWFFCYLIRESNFRLFRAFHLEMYQFFYCLWFKVEDINCFFPEPCQNPSSMHSGDSQYHGKKVKQVKCSGFENLALPQAQKFLVLNKIFRRRLTLLGE